MEPWPFDTITPEQFSLLTEQEKERLEVALLIYLDEVRLQRLKGETPMQYRPYTGHSDGRGPV